MTKREAAVFCLMALLSGVVIGIGGTASLLAANTLGQAGKLVGACLFSLGIYAIITYEMRLFTGMVPDIPDMDIKTMWQLPVCFICNAVGVAIVALLVSNTPIAETVITQGSKVAEGKLNVNNWALSALCSSMFCGILITLAVRSVKYAPKKGLNSTLGVVFPIIVFAFCGFDHSVANMLYFYFYGVCSWKLIGYILLSIIGNILGGVALPLVIKLKEKE